VQGWVGVGAPPQALRPWGAGSARELAASSATVGAPVGIAGLTVICTVNPATAAIGLTVAEFAALSASSVS
jgi:hypothetical protein